MSTSLPDPTCDAHGGTEPVSDARVSLNRIPGELRERPQWVAWHFEKRNGMRTKVPLNPRTLRKARVNDPGTWGTFSEALAVLDRDGTNGVGFVFTDDDPFCGIDLDKCRDPATGDIEVWAHEIIDRLDSYTEVSPSGTGVHVIVRAKLPPGRRRKGRVEMYDSGRFFCMTGHALSDCRIEDRQQEVTAVHAGLGTSAPHPAAPPADPPADSQVPACDQDDAGLIATAIANDPRIARLWSGDFGGYASHSEADLALCSRLANLIGDDPQRLDRLFRRSRLFRPKWDEKHAADGSTYGEMTIRTAAQSWREREAGRVAAAQELGCARERVQKALERAKAGEASAPFDVAADLARVPEAEYSDFKVHFKEALGNRLNLNSLRHAVDSERRRIRRQSPQPPTEDLAQEATAPSYFIASGRMFFRRQTANGEVAEPLTNFVARIETEQVLDDGVEQRRMFELEVALSERLERLRVTADEFNGMNWVVKNLGAAAILHAGMSTRDRAREGIQVLSGPKIPVHKVYVHTGWVKVGDKWVFLNAGGAIGADGVVEGIEVALDPPLNRFHLPPPVQGDDLRQAIRRSLMSLDVLPDRVTIPMRCATFLAPIESVDLLIWVFGDSGAGKSEYAALEQQHFGAEMIRLNLPGNWSSTENALEAQAFLAKDVVFVIDDYAPGGAANEMQKLAAKAERIGRAQGNRSGRGRMRADGTLRPARPPRGIIVSTGEDLPSRKSLRARMIILEVSKED